MKPEKSTGHRLLIVFWLCFGAIISLQSELTSAQDAIADRIYVVPPLATSGEILQKLGYDVTTHFVETQNRVKLRVFEATNPIVNNGRPLAGLQPVLFTHGILVTTSVYVTHMFQITGPQDFTNISINVDDLPGAIEQLNGEPSAKSLPILLLNFGYRVFMFDRRPNSVPPYLERLDEAAARVTNATLGDYRDNMASAEEQETEPESNAYVSKLIDEFTPTPTGMLASLGQIMTNLENIQLGNNSYQDNPPFNQLLLTNFDAFFSYGKLVRQAKISFDAKFWSYNYDDQAKHDWPRVVEFVRSRSQSDLLATVSHSAGGAIQLMSMADQPELAQKLSTAIFWAPSFSVGRSPSAVIIGAPLRPFISRVNQAFPPTFATAMIQSVISFLCYPQSLRKSLCGPILDLILGPSGLPLGPSFANTVLFQTGTQEGTQQMQVFDYDDMLMRKFNYGPAGNLLRYGQLTPPKYELGRIRNQNMAFYAAGTDAFVTPADVRATVNELRVPFKFRQIGSATDFFNHLGFFIDPETSRRVVIPSLLDIFRQTGRT